MSEPLQLHYDGTNGVPSWCDVLLEEGIDKILVTVTERDDNPGLSVTNATGIIATKVAAMVPDRSIEDLIFTERYFPGRNATWDRVEFTWTDNRVACVPVWSHLGEVGYERLRRELGIIDDG